jgi:hypothetical protein
MYAARVLGRILFLAGTEVPEVAMPLTSFEIGNYRSFVEPARVELRPLTLLFGHNNAGKSALARVLPLLRDSVSQRHGLPLDLESATVRGGEFEDIRSRGASSRKLDLSLNWTGHAVASIHLVLRDLPDRRQHVIEWFEVVDSSGQRLECEWDAASPDASGVLNYRIRAADGSDSRFDLLWQGLVPRLRTLQSPHSPAHALVKEAACQLSALDPILWVGATRSAQPRSAKFPRVRPISVRYDGGGTGDVLAWEKQYGGSVFPAVASWYGIHTRAALDVALTADGYSLVVGPNAVNLCDTGEGLTQVLPTLVAAAMAADRARTGDGYAVIEQPELHLHPELHAPLAKYFCDLASGPNAPRLLIETHSENFLLGVQIAVASGALKPEDVLVHWVRKDGEVSSVQPIAMTSDGRPATWPKGVFDEDAALARELLQSRLPRKEA